MRKNPFESIKTVRHLSEYLDYLIIKAVTAETHGSEIEKDLRELNDMLKALEHSVQSNGTDSEKE